MVFTQETFINSLEALRFFDGLGFEKTCSIGAGRIAGIELDKNRKRR